MNQKQSWQQWCFKIGIFGALQFLIGTLLAMVIYPGGTIHEPHLETYSFTANYFSDLGRTKTFDGTSNMLTHLLFKTTLTIGGLCLIIFFIALPTIFKKREAKFLAVITSFFGIFSGLCYLGIASIPWNIDYWGHVFFVKVGFISFLAMTVFYTLAILLDKSYPKRYAWAFVFFGIILSIQIFIMFFGPRAWRSNDALLLQAIAQKVVVYAEIICMLYQSFGALNRSKFLAKVDI